MENYYYSACFSPPVIKRSITVTIARAEYDGKWFQDLMRLALETKYGRRKKFSYS
jgi:hypothetical protein